MLAEEFNASEPAQRVQLDLECPGRRGRVKIRVESYDENLGWYTAGSLSLPLAQLPLLEQAVEEMRARARAMDSSPATIIPFPAQD